jgi:transcriptional regulator with XRE-family HTH domain
MKILFGNAVRRLRKRHRMTQDELAQLAGMCRQSVSNIESNRQAPTARTLVSLAGALDVSAGELVSLAVTDGGESVESAES